MLTRCLKAPGGRPVDEDKQNQRLLARRSLRSIRSGSDFVSVSERVVPGRQRSEGASVDVPADKHARGTAGAHQRAVRAVQRRTLPGRLPAAVRGTIDYCRDRVTQSDTEQMLVNQSQPPGIQRNQGDGADGNRAG
jgi:hypothetical protein